MLRLMHSLQDGLWVEGCHLMLYVRWKALAELQILMGRGECMTQPITTEEKVASAFKRQAFYCKRFAHMDGEEEKNGQQPPLP